jgi:hypothetical protein
MWKTKNSSSGGAFAIQNIIVKYDVKEFIHSLKHQGKSLFPRTTCDIGQLTFMCWYIILNFTFFTFSFKQYARFKYFFTTSSSYIMYIMHLCFLSQKNE